MKTLSKVATLTLMMVAAVTQVFSQQPPAAKPLNLVRGAIGPAGNNTSWSGYSALSLISGAGLIPITTKTTVFYLGFTGGSTADVSNMVLYTTPRGGLKVSAVTPVKFGGVSNPSISLSSTSVCPVQPPSPANPCIVRLDPLTLAPSALNDYYLVVYFTASDTNNSAVGATQPPFAQSSLSGWFMLGDESQLAVGQSIPAGNTGRAPNFLMYVMTN